MNQYAVWGNPISQSKSPRIHQLFAQQTKRTIQYTAQLGDQNQFEYQLCEFFQHGAKGVNITAPFKERAFRMANSHSECCLMAEACNTLKLIDEKLYADNTDGIGLVSDLLRLNWLFPEQKVLILGAGGATKGVLFPLLQASQQITIYNRTSSKAVTLAQKFAKLGSIQSMTWEEITHSSFDLIINATSLGLSGKWITLPDELLISAKLYDMQYASFADTPFLRYARQRGAKYCADGLGMLVGQAAYAFKLWEGVLPEIEPVLRQIKKELGC